MSAAEPLLDHPSLAPVLVRSEVLAAYSLRLTALSNHAFAGLLGEGRRHDEALTLLANALSMALASAVLNTAVDPASAARRASLMSVVAAHYDATAAAELEIRRTGVN